jgi:hypothetical protein
VNWFAQHRRPPACEAMWEVYLDARARARQVARDKRASNELFLIIYGEAQRAYDNYEDAVERELERRHG